MDDGKKKTFRGKPPRAGGAARPANGGDGGKRFRKHDTPRPYEKGGEGYARQDAGNAPPKKRPHAEPREAATGEGGGERKPRSFGGDRPPRQDGPLKYWGKRPGRSEREQAKAAGSETEGVPPRERQARTDGGPQRSAGPRGVEGRPPRAEGRPPRAAGDRFDRDKPARPGKPFDKESRPARSYDKDRVPRPDRSDRPQRSFEPVRPSQRREEAATAEPERIAKRLARAGISSRRDAENLIALGRVKVNGIVLTSPATNVTPSDRIEVDDREIPAIERTRLFLFHKPAGVVTTNRDPEGRRTVFDVLPEGLPRLMTIGRLDINTEGLLLLTNDGGLSRVLELPATGWLRRYRVRVHGKVDEAKLGALKDGVAVDGVFYGAVEATLEREKGTNAWLNIGLREGKNREVKNILGSLGLEVTRLIRVSYGPFQLGELEEGQVMEIRGRMLRDQLGDRLVEESGANFDADVAKPFSNKPVRRGDQRPERSEDRPPRQGRQIGYEKPGGLIKNFRRDRETKREDVLGRLSTSRPERSGHGGPDGFKRNDGEGRGPRLRTQAEGRPSGDRNASESRGKPKGRGDRDSAPAIEPGARKANVWMAPGARPAGKRPSERAATKRQAGDGPAGKPKSGRGGRPSAGDGPTSRGPRRPGGPGKPPRKG